MVHLLDTTSDDIFASRGPDVSCPKTFRLPPIERPEGCYVRTRGDLMMAVIRKQDLLACDTDRELQIVKKNARPVCVKVSEFEGNLSLA